jgi:hypothetical protein
LCRLISVWRICIPCKKEVASQGVTARAEFRASLGFFEEDDSVGVGAGLVVFYAPAAGGFCEGVRVDEDF